MDFDLTQDQQEIKGVARELLAARSPWAKVREAAESQTYDGALWSELVELGWPGIAVAEQHGGQGLGAVELVLIDGDEATLVHGAGVDALDPIDSTRRYAVIDGGVIEPLGPGAADRVRAAIAAEVVGLSQRG